MEDTIETKPAEKATRKATAAEATAAEAPRAPKRYKLTIYSGEDKADKGDVVLAHNYRQILIQRDTQVEVDECFIEVLKHSVIHTINKDAATGKETPIQVPRHSFNYEPA